MFLALLIDTGYVIMISVSKRTWHMGSCSWPPCVSGCAGDHGFMACETGSRNMVHVIGHDVRLAHVLGRLRSHVKRATGFAKRIP